jgi:polygalacturonase
MLLMEFGCASSSTSRESAFDVQTFGATPNLKTKDTAAFQKALDDCAARGGGRVIVPPGDYLIGAITIGSNTTLELSQGATLHGSPDPADYPLETVRWEGKWVTGHRALISAENADHIAIIGPGTIAGDLSIGKLRNPRGPLLVELKNCQDVKLAGFSTSFYRLWSIHPVYCRDVRISNVTIRSSGTNGDGIDVDSCSNVRIDACNVESGDDSIAIKSGRGVEGYQIARPSENIVISRCTLGDAGFACIGIGTEMSGGVRDVRIEHCLFRHSHSQSIYIKSGIGRGGTIENITGEDLDVLSARGGFLRINMLNAGIVDDHSVEGDEGIPTARNIKFSNIRVDRCGPLVEAVSIPTTRPVEGLSISNVFGMCRKGISMNNVVDADVHDVEVVAFKGPLLAIRNTTGKGLEDAKPYIPTTQPTTRRSRSRRGQPTTQPAVTPEPGQGDE